MKRVSINTKIMNFKRFMLKFNLTESLKETELNKILDKISRKIKLLKSEEDFLNNYSTINDNDIMNFLCLSRQSTFDKITELLDKNKKVICNLCDRDGKIGSDIVSIENDYSSDICTLCLKNGSKFIMGDNFLYNIIYHLNNDSYSLEEEEEFFEKIPVKNND